MSQAQDQKQQAYDLMLIQNLAENAEDHFVPSMLRSVSQTIRHEHSQSRFSGSGPHLDVIQDGIPAGDIDHERRWPKVKATMKTWSTNCST
jgi:hypothetical protein